MGGVEVNSDRFGRSVLRATGLAGSARLEDNRLSGFRSELISHVSESQVFFDELKLILDPLAYVDFR